MIGLVKLKGPEKVPFSTSGTSKMTRRENVVRKIGVFMPSLLAE
jgi:hypothetical protein